MITFILGCFLGTFLGIGVLCLVQSNNIKEPSES